MCSICHLSYFHQIWIYRFTQAAQLKELIGDFCIFLFLIQSVNFLMTVEIPTYKMWEVSIMIICHIWIGRVKYFPDPSCAMSWTTTHSMLNTFFIFDSYYHHIDFEVCMKTKENPIIICLLFELMFDTLHLIHKSKQQ